MTMNSAQTTIFDALPEEERNELVSVEAPNKTQKSAKTSQQSKSVSSVKSAEEPEPEEYEIDRVVYYAGHRKEVPSRTMKLEEVRAWLEREHFPELTKERTDMVYDKTTGHIVPVLKGHKKGAQMTVFTEHPTETLPNYYFLDEYGVVSEVRRTQAGVFSIPVRGTGLSEPPVTLSVPRIPVGILEEIVRVFQTEPDVEHLAYVVWDTDHHYSVYWPEQTSSAVSVQSEEGFMETDERFIVLQVHSHGRLPAFFSRQDDSDEIRTGLYGVVGLCHQPYPEMRFRMSCGGKFWSVAPGEIFSGVIRCGVVS
ncbi:Mov34/MPN/PAD-1 family protein [Alicyclobacillus ferrooxydans]|uniref:JAB domain-containing protein n=1 Tax=Alicyclobacillus ferrooxydans TaxID=471514 RepID=A0A0P9GWJ5_9BACL|nr:Mov34/MPN/PAD-1 family protein [Alicyclobacillus ferrooxydans]KPV45690.1 hypothetical protein AN477_01940 [Alicyclobacillus ferrooxydans]